MKGRLGKGLAALAAGMVLLSGCASGKAPERFTESFVGLFDTASTVTGYAESEQDFSNQMTRYEELLSEYVRLYDSGAGSGWRGTGSVGKKFIL